MITSFACYFNKQTSAKSQTNNAETVKQVEEEEEERVEIKWQKSQQPMAHIHTQAHTHACWVNGCAHGESRKSNVNTV